MGVIDINQGRDRRNQRLSLLRHFNTAGEDGRNSWHEFVRLAKQSGFNNDDFRARLGLSAFQVRLQENGGFIPSETQRADYKRAVVGTLYGKHGFPDPDLQPA